MWINSFLEQWISEHELVYVHLYELKYFRVNWQNTEDGNVQADF